MDHGHALMLPLLPMVLCIYTWNVRRLGALKSYAADGHKILVDFCTLGQYDIMVLQKHKLFAEDAPFVSKRLGVVRSVWAPAQGNHKGGLAILMGAQYVGNVLALGVDTKFMFVWVKLATEAGEIGLVNVYAPQSPLERAEVWQHMQGTLEEGVPWFLMGDFNFAKRRVDKVGGTWYIFMKKRMLGQSSETYGWELGPLVSE